MKFCLSSPIVNYRLFKRTLFDHLRFEEGRRYEDFIIMPWLYDRADKIVGMDEVFYFYNQCNVNSIMTMTAQIRAFQFDELCVHIERVRMVECDDERFYQHCLLPRIEWAWHVLWNDAAESFLTEPQRDYIGTFLQEYRHFNKRKVLLFCFNHARFLFNIYSRHRYNRVQKRQLAGA